MCSLCECGSNTAAASMTKKKWRIDFSSSSFKLDWFRWCCCHKHRKAIIAMRWPVDVYPMTVLSDHIVVWFMLTFVQALNWYFKCTSWRILIILLNFSIAMKSNYFHRIAIRCPIDIIIHWKLFQFRFSLRTFFTRNTIYNRFQIFTKYLNSKIKNILIQYLCSCTTDGADR